ncbi:hypothetical protein NDU88_005206 [Pleurodeles waltl]|uniref:Uncharacterized protein n=1 Tax=Pleurodeles waltl TaxID=8319 RepID=A0AAV7WYV0_PLEWA|nr:hypothetical protein NDU88_005206 [Pleurodeles waltl]
MGRGQDGGRSGRLSKELRSRPTFLLIILVPAGHNIDEAPPLVPGATLKQPELVAVCPATDQRVQRSEVRLAPWTGSRVSPPEADTACMRQRSDSVWLPVGPPEPRAGEPGWRRHHVLGFLAGERSRELRNTWLGRDLAERPSTNGMRGGGARPSCWYLPPRRPRRGTHSTRSRHGVCARPHPSWARTTSAPTPGSGADLNTSFCPWPGDTDRVQVPEGDWGPDTSTLPPHCQRGLGPSMGARTHRLTAPPRTEKRNNNALSPQGINQPRATDPNKGGANRNKLMRSVRWAECKTIIN